MESSDDGDDDFVNNSLPTSTRSSKSSGKNATSSSSGGKRSSSSKSSNKNSTLGSLAVLDTKKQSSSGTNAGSVSSNRDDASHQSSESRSSKTGSTSHPTRRSVGGSRRVHRDATVASSSVSSESSLPNEQPQPPRQHLGDVLEKTEGARHGSSRRRGGGESVASGNSRSSQQKPQRTRSSESIQSANSDSVLRKQEKQQLSTKQQHSGSSSDCGDDLATREYQSADEVDASDKDGAITPVAGSTTRRKSTNRSKKSTSKSTTDSISSSQTEIVEDRGVDTNFNAPQESTRRDTNRVVIRDDQASTTPSPNEFFAFDTAVTDNAALNTYTNKYNDSDAFFPTASSTGNPSSTSETATSTVPFPSFGKNNTIMEDDFFAFSSMTLQGNDNKAISDNNDPLDFGGQQSFSFFDNSFVSHNQNVFPSVTGLTNSSNMTSNTGSSIRGNSRGKSSSNKSTDASTDFAFPIIESAASFTTGATPASYTNSADFGSIFNPFAESTPVTFPTTFGSTSVTTTAQKVEGSSLPSVKLPRKLKKSIETATPSWDTSPIMEVPQSLVSKASGTTKKGGISDFSIQQNTIWTSSPSVSTSPSTTTTASASEFHCAPINNPLNGNVIFCTSNYYQSHESHVFCLQEIDPYRYNNSNNYSYYHNEKFTRNKTTNSVNMSKNNYLGTGTVQQMEVMPILNDELRSKVATKYDSTIHSVVNVLALQSGLHFAAGRMRVRVSAIVELRLVEKVTTASSTTTKSAAASPKNNFQQHNNPTLKLVLVWRWGYGVPLIGLQYALSPPNGSDFTFDSDTLKVADNILFIAGSSPKGSFIFICNPSVSGSWSANSLSTTSKVRRVSFIDRTHYPQSVGDSSCDGRHHPYVVIAFADGNISVWTYMAAMNDSAFQETTVRRVLFPLCRFDHTSVFSSLKPSSIEEKEKLDSVVDDTSFGDCTDIAWLPSNSSLMMSSSSLLLVALAFQSGIVIFHIALPATVVDESSTTSTNQAVQPLPEPTNTTKLSSTPKLVPIAAKRWSKSYKHASLALTTLGPSYGGGYNITVLVAGPKTGEARLGVLFLEFPMHLRGNSMPKDTTPLLALHILAKQSVPKQFVTKRLGMLRSSGTNTALLYTQRDLMTVSLTAMRFSEFQTIIESLRYPITSIPAGVSSLGDPIALDSVTDANQGVLYLYTTVQCQRQKIESEEATTTKSIYWTLPTQRHWLCRMIPDDMNASSTEEKKTDQGFGNSEESFSCVRSELVCELYHDLLVDLAPCRIVKCPTNDCCAILFRPSIGSNSRNGKSDGSYQPIQIAFVNPSNNDAVVEVVEGRDVAFFPIVEAGACYGLLLGQSGGLLRYFRWNVQLSSIEFVTTSCRPIVGVEADMEFVDCRRIMFRSNGSDISLLAWGKRLRDNRICFVSGESRSIDKVRSDTWSLLLPNIIEGRKCWLDENEDVCSVIGLDLNDDGNRNIAIATSTRVLILSHTLQPLAEKQAKSISHSLVPLGSFTVCFELDGAIRYLCCLSGSCQSGIMSSLTVPRDGPTRAQLVALRPDRFILLDRISGFQLNEFGERSNRFLLPSPLVKPALLLEPLVANAVCIGIQMNKSMQALRTVIEKFGRKVALNTHGEGEGIGQKGAGMTAKVLQILEQYGLRHAATWLLMGVVNFELSSNSVILPPWLPISAKSSGVFNADGQMHILSAGDSYLSEYVKSPDERSPTSLPRISDPTSYISSEYAIGALMHSRTTDALRLFDMSGTESAHTNILQIALLLSRDKHTAVTGILEFISGFKTSGLSRPSSTIRPPGSLAALAVLQKRQTDQSVKVDHIARWITPLAPSLQRIPTMKRARPRLLGEKVLKPFGRSETLATDRLWVAPCNESKHFWNEGPGRDKSKLLLLDRTEDWLERHRPRILGKEGISDRGEKRLADILNQDDDSFGGKSDLDSVKDIWVQGVGEGRSDEANLVGYFRFSEGEKENSSWKVDGLSDLSTYQNKAVLVGNPNVFSLQTSTSSVDEGDTSKVKALRDLVFENSGVGLASGLAIAAPRGSSLDIGCLHMSEHDARMKCTIEFWFYLPSKESIIDDIILVRRTIGEKADNYQKVCLASKKENMLWELAVRKSGEIEFRSCGGSILLSTQNYESSSTEKGTENQRNDIVGFERWNHVCLVLTCKGMELTKCAVKLYLKGTEVASATSLMTPPGLKEKDLNNTSTLENLLEKSNILLGLNHCPGFRLTELRFWACARSSDDVHSLLYEYLTAAEQRKKVSIRITNKNKKGGNVGKFGFTIPNPEGIQPPRGMIPMKSGGLVSHTNKASSEQQADLSFENKFAQEEGAFHENYSNPMTFEREQISTIDQRGDDLFGTTEPIKDFSPLTSNRLDESKESMSDLRYEANNENNDFDMEGHAESDGPITLWDTALPLSQQIRASAAAALIRGPPATRHYGGNRGGLPDFSGVDRFGVGGIAICGSEKTIVFRDNEDPPALTYPIGASGAVVSDQMDDEGSEFLCCFLAKERRMVVFELRSRTVVVELQMTTKLNFWRYLPPEASENTLCFMLVTPVGGFHWMPLEESPRPHQVWKRGSDLQGKKIVAYEEGGSNGLDDHEIQSRVGLVLATKASGGGSLEAWIVPIGGNSITLQVSLNILGACLCQPLFIDDGPFLPLIVTVNNIEDGICVNLLSIHDSDEGILELDDMGANQDIDLSDYVVDFDPPALAMGTYPEALCVSLSNIIVVIVRRKGVVAAFELEEDQLNLIAQECVDHYIVDAVMRYSAEVGGAEIVLLLADEENPKDGRIVSFCFRSAV